MMSGIETKWGISLTEVMTPPRLDDTALNPSGQNILALRTRAAPELDGFLVKYLVGEIAVPTLGPHTRVGRMGLINETGVLVVLHVPSGVLDVADIDRLEVALGIRLHNVGQLRGHFVT